ncbi:TetR/AcrR family transcriptional regulator [Robertmurraya andreesenii]|uniref:AcrR family transcriptional regulator n=1 Tax=Anoxybacillus andreesenii TaxID=1325932 RepID=A0ABT9V182_9BACL|nr:TetR/AcrR family transcriptional regulator [Robertmurraya andreesenii]MDQ0154706.1 AcrR family transcriptional regulator [Robertmurraya andreesenii]
MKKNGFDLRREKKMKNIEEAMLQLLNQKDISNITMDEIAKNAGVSKVTLFNYYNTKDNLINTVILNFFSSVQEEYERLIESDLPFEQTYREITKYKMEKVLSMTSVFFHNMMQQYASETTFFDKNAQETSDQLILRLFQKGRKEGKVNPAYTDEVLLTFMHIFTEGLKSPSINSNHMMKYGDQISQIFLNGLR